MFCIVLLALFPAIAAEEPARAPVRLESPVQDKIFYLLSMIERTPEVRRAVQADATLAHIAAARLSAMDEASKTCKIDLPCNAAAFRWTNEQSAEAGRALGRLYSSSPAMHALVEGALHSSGFYVRYNRLPGEEFLERAWADCVRGMNHAIEVYALGTPPQYPAIDSMTYDAKAEGYRRVIRNLVAVIEDDRSALDMFFAASLRFADEVLFLNHRDEAGRFEPMEYGENAAALAHMKSVDWSRYPYSAIVVLGSGNDRPGVRLSAFGKLRDEVAAKRYREGKAPFVLVSGGYVHPARTEYAEAIEMKKDLMSRFGIPAEAILIDPHARHTTTNIRNAARLIYRYGMPFDKKALVTSDPEHIDSIESPKFAERCIKELGYVPHKLIGRASPFDVEILPLVDSLQADPLDPLDP